MRRDIHNMNIQNNQYSNRQTNPLLMNYHKDFGKTPQYLIKKMEEYKEQKEYQ